MNKTLTHIFSEMRATERKRVKTDQHKRRQQFEDGVLWISGALVGAIVSMSGIVAIAMWHGA